MSPVADLVYDVGMHKGEDTAYYLRKGYRVVGFEANPDLAAACRERFRNEVAHGRLHVIEGAISHSDEAVVFYRHPTRSEWGTVDAAWVEWVGWSSESERIEVQPVDFPECLRTYGVPCYMKVDIEGADRLCLEAMGELADRPTYVSLESERESFGELMAELDLLDRLGYDRFAAVQQKWMDRREIRTVDLQGEPLAVRFEPDSSGPFGSDLDAQWVDKEQLVSQYAAIFRRYRLWESPPFTRTRHGRRVRQALEALLGRPFPGWYDTHAWRSLSP